MPAPTYSVTSSSYTSSEEADDEATLLDDNDVVEDTDSGLHELRTAPLLTRNAYTKTRLGEQVGQYGVLGRILDGSPNVHSLSSDDPTRLYLNTNAPLSAVVCGVQGSGKSHTVSVMLESMFITGYPATGHLAKPLSGLVFHFGETGSSSRPCEAAYLGVSDTPGVSPPAIRVYVSPGSIKRMQRLYDELGDNVHVEPLYFSEAELDASAFLSMMAVGSSEGAPLYMQSVLNALRQLGENFTYHAFMARLEDLKQNMNPQQKCGLEQRLDLLTSFTKPGTSFRKLSSSSPRRFAKGQLTVIDLSDPFIDPPSACGLFEIILRLFERAEVDTGKVLVVDEAHKYLSQTRNFTGLTRSLLSVIRQQRHLSMRVIVSTQEPTIIPPVIIDLCSVVVLHRFSSKAWWEHLSKHVSADITKEETFDKVVQLKTGQAIIMAPAGLDAKARSQSIVDDEENNSKLVHFGRQFFVMKTRRRVTADGGVSLLAVSTDD
ncbi:hypothetical protein FA95DRAFT_1552963 [Auriscalpium vulgare]|uniref:Uncharacterized protein n=1 Tax=Auriscalpium vulgare TaxID=40419 RepID=A0ACB8SA79_9AGAM|nr:hypothetical protein FA95DRAFT_1552963 [Auriscalpium vulgare]